MKIKSDALSALLQKDGINLTKSKANGQIMTHCFNPNHDDKTPSLAINQATGVYFCHGCGIKGNAYTYLIEIKGESKDRAIEILEQFGWVSDKIKKEKEGYKRRKDARRGLPPFTKSLWPSPRDSKGKDMLSYKLVADYKYVDKEGCDMLIKRRWENREDVSHIKKTFALFTFAKKGGWWASKPTNEALPAEDRHEQYTLYNYPSVLASPPDKQVWVVEGEKLVDTVNKVLKKTFGDGLPPCVSVCGGNTIKIDEHDFSPLRNRKVLLIADQDEPGRRYMQKLADHLYHHLSCRVRLCLPIGENKIDVADILNEGGWKACKEWLKENNIYEYEPKSKDGPVSKDLPPDYELIFGEKYFKILGVKGESVVFQSKTTAQIIEKKQYYLTNEAHLITLAPVSFWLSLCKDPKSLDKTNRLNIADAIIQHAQRKGLFSITKSGYGRGGAKINDKYYFNLGKKVLSQDLDRKLSIENHIVDVDVDDALFIPGNAIKISDDSSSAISIGRKLYDAVLGYRWDSIDYAKAFAGFLVTSIIGGCLEYRPMLWFLAPATSGKSWLLDNVLKKLLGSMLVDGGNVTEAGLGRLMSSDSLAAYIDEFEPYASKNHSDRYNELLLLIRLASTGQSQRIRAIGEDVRPRFSAIITSINRPVLSDADQSRYFVVKLANRGVENWYELENAIKSVTASKKMRILRSHIIRNAGIIADEASMLERAMSKVYQKMNHRERKIIAALTAGVRFLATDKNITITKDVNDQLEVDELQPLHDILTAIIPVKLTDGTEYISVGECVDKVFNKDLNLSEPYDRTLQRYGIKAERNGGEYYLYLHINSEPMVRLLRDSRFSNISIKEYLSSLDGVNYESHRTYIAKRQVRTKRLETDLLKQLGLNLGTGGIYESSEPPF